MLERSRIHRWKANEKIYRTAGGDFGKDRQKLAMGDGGKTSRERPVSPPDTFNAVQNPRPGSPARHAYLSPFKIWVQEHENS